MSKSPHLPLPGIRWRGLTLQLFAWVVLPLIALLLLVTFGSLALHQRAMRTLVGERDERAARTAASALTEQLNHRTAAIRSLALRAADGHPPSHILLSSNFLLPDFDAGLAFFSPEGDFLASTGDDALWTNPTDAFRIELNEMLAVGDADPRFSSAIPSSTGRKQIVLVSATAHSGAPIAVGAFYPSTLAERTLSSLFKTGDQGIICLIAPNGQILFSIREEAPLAEPLSHPGVSEALRGESGSLYTPAEDGEHVVAYSGIAPVGWALIVEETWEAVSTPTLNTTLFAPLILIPVLLLSLVALWFGARKIVQPLQNLEVRARELAWGDYQSIEVSAGGIAEIGRLQNTLIYLAHKVQTAQSSLRGYIGAITTGQEDERRRLARELHDETIQDLIALNQRVQLAQMNVTERNPVDQLDEIQKMTEKTIQDLRRLTRALRPLYLDDLGLVAALDMLARETQESTAIPVSFQRLGRESRLSPDVELALYRMAQEGLTNIQRHAQARQAILKIEFTPENVTLTISDNGCGFEPPESPAEFAPGGHFGLLGLYERAELIEAKLEIYSAPDEGTRVVVILPFTERSS
jgi:signal transduction histidine kinase